MRTVRWPSRRLFLLAVAISLSCASVDLTPAGDHVRVSANPESVKGCQFLGNVNSENFWGVKSAENKMRNDAAKLGADIVLQVNPVTTGGGMHFHGAGEAYRCSGGLVAVYTLKPGDQIVSEDLVPADQRLKPLPGYQIVTVKGDRTGNGMIEVFQVYLPKPPS